MRKIILIEDNLDVRENTAEMLELAGYSVQVAENGKIGVSMVNEVHPDLIICDIMMPELDGYSVFHILNKSAKTSSIPFIFLTAKSEKEDLRKGMNLGADDYLTKPFEEHDLLDAVESRLRKNDLLRTEFAKTAEGLSEFLDGARGLHALETLSQDRIVKSFKPGHSIYLEGDHPNRLYFINHGRVKTSKIHEDGKEYITKIFNEGEFLGHLALLEGGPYSESATALESTDLSIIPQEDFLTLLHQNRDVANRFIKLLANDLSETEQRLINLAYDSVRRRVAEALTMLEKKYREKDIEPTVVPIRREDLANLVGTAKETVIRTITDFKREGLIDIKGRQILILQPDRLAHLRF